MYIACAREEREKPRDRDDRVGGKGGARARGGWEKGTNEDGRRTTTITLKAVRDTPAMVLIYRPRFPSPRCHGFHGVLVIIRTFRPPSTFASRPPPPIVSASSVASFPTASLSSAPPPPFPPLDARLHPLPPPPLPLRRYLAASLRASACIPYNRYVTL